MQEITIRLKTIQEVEEFEMAIRNINCDIDIVSEGGKYIVDAKSIMGILSLDLTKRLILAVHTEDPDVLWHLSTELRRVGVLQP